MSNVGAKESQWTRTIALSSQLYDQQSAGDAVANTMASGCGAGSSADTVLCTASIAGGEVVGWEGMVARSRFRG